MSEQTTSPSDVTRSDTRLHWSGTSQTHVWSTYTWSSDVEVNWTQTTEVHFSKPIVWMLTVATCLRSMWDVLWSLCCEYARLSTSEENKIVIWWILRLHIAYLFVLSVQCNVCRWTDRTEYNFTLACPSGVRPSGDYGQDCELRLAWSHQICNIFPIPNKMSLGNTQNGRGKGHVKQICNFGTVNDIDHSNFTQSLRGKSKTKFIQRMALSGRGQVTWQIL